MAAKWLLWLGLWGALGGMLAHLPAVRADEHEGEWALRVFAQQPRSQRNRVPAEQLSAEVAARLTSIVDTGVRGCDCLPRKLRWVWSLSRPSDPLHPTLVVSFEDKPRENAKVSIYERLAQISFKNDKYVIAGVLTLNRPIPGSTDSLTVRMLPRRDFDQDGQLDIAVSYQETWAQVSECGRILFQSGSEQPAFEKTDCAATKP